MTQPTEYIQISRQEYDFLKSMIPDFVQLIDSLDRMGDTLDPILPKAQAVNDHQVNNQQRTAEKPNMLQQGKMLMKLLPAIQELIPTLGQELEQYIKPICIKYRSFVQSYQQSKLSTRNQSTHHGNNHPKGDPGKDEQQG